MIKITYNDDWSRNEPKRKKHFKIRLTKTFLNAEVSTYHNDEKKKNGK